MNPEDYSYLLPLNYSVEENELGNLVSNVYYDEFEEFPVYSFDEEKIDNLTKLGIIKDIYDLEGIANYLIDKNIINNIDYIQLNERLNKKLKEQNNNMKKDKYIVVETIKAETLKQKINEMGGFSMLGKEFKTPDEELLDELDEVLKMSEKDESNVDETVEEKEEYKRTMSRGGGMSLGDGFAMSENELIDFASNMVEELREEYKNLKFVDDIGKKFSLKENSINKIKNIILSEKSKKPSLKLFKYLTERFNAKMETKTKCYDHIATYMNYPTSSSILKEDYHINEEEDLEIDFELGEAEDFNEKELFNLDDADEQPPFPVPASEYEINEEGDYIDEVCEECMNEEDYHTEDGGVYEDNQENTWHIEKYADGYNVYTFDVEDENGDPIDIENVKVVKMGGKYKIVGDDNKLIPIEIKRKMVQNLTEELDEKLDPVGKDDGDVNNDGKIDDQDAYILNRRKAIKKDMLKDLKKKVD